MAVTTVGFDGTITEAEWARLQSIAAAPYVSSGLVTTAAGGTRQTSTTLGTALLPGLVVDSDAATTLSFAANVGSTNRVDLVVVKADWSGTGGVSTIEVHQGTSTVPPTVTQDPGTLWEMPIAKVTVRPSVTTLLSTDVEVCKPQDRRRWSTTVAASSTQALTTTSNVDIPGLSITVPNPDPAAVYIVSASLDLTNTGTTSETCVGELVVDGSAQAAQIVGSFRDAADGATSQRVTVSQTWRIAGLPLGSKVFKIRGRLSAAGGYSVAAGHSSMTIQQVS